MYRVRFVVTIAVANIMEYSLVMDAQDSSKDLFGGTEIMCANQNQKEIVSLIKHIEISAERADCGSVSMWE